MPPVPSTGRRAKPGRFGSLAFALKIGISGESAPKYWQGKHENVADYGCLRVSRILVNKASGDSVLQVLGNKARKKLPNRPGFTHVQGSSREV